MEGLVISVIIFFVMITVVGELMYGQQASVRASDLTRANNLALEGIEVVRDVRMADFIELGEGSYGLSVKDDGRWQLESEQPETIDDYFHREVIVSDSGFAQKEVEVVVSWSDDQEVRLMTEFQDWLPTKEDWANPLYDGDFDLTPENSGSNNHKVRAVEQRGLYIYVGNENSNGKEFLIFDIKGAPVLEMAGTLNLDGNVHDIALYGDYAFLASSSQEEELQVINIGDSSSPIQVASFDLSGQNDALSLDISSDGSLLALGREKGDFYVFDITTPTNPLLRGQLSFSQAAYINTTRIQGDYAYLATGDGALKIIDISNSLLPSVAADLNLGDDDEVDCSSGALSLDLVGDRAYVGCASSDGFFIINIANSSAPIIVSRAEFDGSDADIYHISFASSESSVFLMSSDSSYDFQVWDVSNELEPIRLSFIDLTGTPSQADYSPLVQKMFVGLVSDPEIQIVAPTITYTE